MMKDYTMVEEFISKAMKTATYQHKEGTANSYYWQSGSRILPNRLSISKGSEMTSVQRKRRNLLSPVVGQILGRFTKIEESPLKQHKPFDVSFTLWFLDDKRHVPVRIGSCDAHRVRGDFRADCLCGGSCI